MSKMIDLTGRRFGRLVVIGEHGRDKWNQAIWACRCDCGNETNVVGGSLRNGNTKSCGCWRKDMPIVLKTTHNMTYSSVYASWWHMIDRCNNKENNRYKYYGGRGISVCDRWMDINTFYRDMGDKPDGLTIERIDNNGNYEPDNCKWATIAEQNRNNTRTILIKYENKVRCVSEWARIIGIHKNTLFYRLRHHTPEIAFNMPKSKRL